MESSVSACLSGLPYSPHSAFPSSCPPARLCCYVFKFFILFPSYLPFKSSYIPFCHLKQSLGFNVKRSFLYLSSIFKQKEWGLGFDRMSARPGYFKETGPWKQRGLLTGMKDKGKKKTSCFHPQVSFMLPGKLQKVTIFLFEKRKTCTTELLTYIGINHHFGGSSLTFN